MRIDVRHNLEEFNRDLETYLRLSRKTPEEVLLKQGGKLAYALYIRLRKAAPAKGEVRSERLSALAQGQGVKVRPSVRKAVMQKHGARSDLASRKVVFGKSGRTHANRKGKRLNLQALMVQRELSLRESARGFVAFSARYPRTLEKKNVVKSRYGPFLSRAGLEAKQTSMKFTWDPARGEMAANAAEGLNRPAGRAVIAHALRDTSEDIRKYVADKLAKNARKAKLK